MLSNSIAEMRTCGEGFIIVDQSPSAVDMSAIRNTNTKIIHRLPEFSDRELVGKSSNLDNEQIKELAKLQTGVSAIYQNNWVEAVLCQIAKSNLAEDVYQYEPIKNGINYNANFIKCLVDICFDRLDKKSFESVTENIDILEISTQKKVDILNSIVETKTISKEYAKTFLYEETNFFSILTAASKFNSIKDFDNCIERSVINKCYQSDRKVVNDLVAILMSYSHERNSIDNNCYKAWQEYKK